MTKEEKLRSKKQNQECVSWKPTENILSMRNLLTGVKDGFDNTSNEQMGMSIF